MKSTIIHNLPAWQVTSYGNGLAYEVAHKPLKMSIFVQGDDAEQFRTELEALTERAPMMDYSDALAVLWNDYGASATAWKATA